MDKALSYMQRALEQAKQAFAEDEVPIGAVVVDPISGEIVAEAHNMSEHGTDATAHAEILAMQRACTKLKQKRLWDMDLYVTLEPCTMCAAAISFMRIKNLYIGAIDSKGGGVISGVRFYEQPTCHHKPQVFSGILESECGQILKEFFKSKRDKNC